MPGASQFGAGLLGAPSMKNGALPSMGYSPGDKTGLSMANPSLRQMANKNSARPGILSTRSRPGSQTSRKTGVGSKSRTSKH